MTPALSRLLRPLGVAALAVAALAGCDGDGPDLGNGGGAESPLVVVSSEYASATGAAAGATTDRLRSVVRQLREDTGSSGWQAVQDDASGRAEELSGGRAVLSGDPEAAARDFVARYGAAFSPEQPRLVLSTSDDEPGGGVVLRLAQQHGEVPVQDAALTVTARSVGNGASEVSVVRGRLVELSTVPASPTVTAESAAAAVTAATGVAPDGPPALVVHTEAQPRLAWHTTVTLPTDDVRGSGTEVVSRLGRLPGVEGPSEVYVDATTGLVIGVRPVSPERARDGAPEGVLGNYDFELPPPGRPVTASGVLPTGERVEVPAEQLPDGSVVLVDATSPGADRATGKGVVVILDGSRSRGDTSELPPVLRFPSTEIDDVDALAAAWGVRRSLDYFREEHDRLSFDDANSPVPVVVNLRDEDGGCVNNAYFATAPGISHMAVYDRCVEGGTPIVHTMADLGTIGHELTHGVNHTRTEFRSTVQHGAIDEGTADYFGTVIENLATGGDSTVASHFSCKGLSNDVYCLPQTRGQTGLRDVDAGATFDDYLFTVGEPFGIAAELGDSGHGNSLVWSNALWGARKVLTASDGGDNNTSAKAKAFDRVVHRATTLHLDAQSDMTSLAEAIVRTAQQEDGLDGSDVDAVRRVFAAHKLCRNCQLPPRVARQLAGGSALQVRPQVTDAGVVFTQFSGRLSSTTVLRESPTSEPRGLDGGEGLVTASASAGRYTASNVVTFGEQGETVTVVLRDVVSGQARALSSAGLPFVAPAVSEGHVAFVEAQGDAPVLRVVPVGGGDGAGARLDKVPAHLALSGDRLAVEFEDGALAVSDTGLSSLESLGSVAPPSNPAVQLPAGGIALDGDRLAVLADPLGPAGPLLVLDLAGGGRTTITEQAAPFGLAFRDGLLLWSEVTGRQAGKVAELVRGAVDTEIRGFSYETRTFYRMVGQRGQQGFPSYDGKRLAWQDSVTGSDDVFVVDVPDGL